MGVEWNNDKMHPSCGGALFTLCKVARRSRVILTLPTQTHMAHKDFFYWGRKQNFGEDALAEIERISAISIDDKTVRTDCIYTPEDIVHLWETNGMKIDPARHEFAIVGGCANGDPIALSLRAQEMGSVWYIDHERMHGEDLRDICVKVADSIIAFYRTLCNDSNFPYDYYSASQARRG